jgi:hypothetical protein
MPGRAAGRRAGDAADQPPFFFEGIESPNGTIFPDALLDQVMPFLSPTEWKVCSYIVRRTFGWKKASDRISLEQICHGIVRRDGTRLDHGTQLDRKTAIKALRGLEAKGVIVAQRNYSDERGFEATTYGLRFRGQPPTRTLVEKLPQGRDHLGENLPQGQGEALHQPPGEDFPQPGGAVPLAPVAPLHPQPTEATTNTLTGGHEQGTATQDAASGAPARPGRLPALAHDEERLSNPAGPSASPSTAPPRTDATLAGARALEAETPVGTPARRRGPAGAEAAAADAAAIWAAVLARLAQQMTAANYETWLADTRPLGRRGTTLIVGAPNRFVREWLQTRCRALVRRALQEVAPALTDVTFAVAAPPAPQR